MEPVPDLQYHAFLIRLWREGGESPWRISIEDAQTSRQRHFSDLDELFSYLQGLARGSSIEPPRDGPDAR